MIIDVRNNIFHWIEIMMRVLLPVMLLMFSLNGISHADDVVDLIDDAENDESEKSEAYYVLDASWNVADPLGEFDPTLGAGAALNRALSLVFSGHASPIQIEMELEMTREHEGNGYMMAPFAVDVLDRLQAEFANSFPEPMELRPFELEPSLPPVISADNPNLVEVMYDREEYLERLLQRLYFKLIQGPVLLTVPYQADAENVPQEYRNWNNFRYASNDNTMEWDDVRLVWVDWDLTQTVVLQYEDGLIACYDSGKKYYIDHTAAVATAGAMLAHPDLVDFPADTALNYVLTPVEE